MRDLPSGVVTFVFTDIEGSTRLLRELGEGYSQALAEHRSALRSAFTTHNGVEVDTQGDAFFFVFHDARDAIAGARAAQNEMEGGPVRVRMGVHTGTPTRTDEGYVGLDVHQGARIAAAGHGGQVLVSHVTRELLGDMELRDLGRHRVKDFEQPVWLFQVGVGEFPPLRTMANTNLPRPASTFIGRDRELEAITKLLRDHRLVSLTGPGGSGKTRLAIEAAIDLVGDFLHGVFWVELAAIRDADLVIPAIGQTLGMHGDLAADVGDKYMLLLLDNVEQVIQAGLAIAALVEACPNLAIIVTSRERLHVRGETAYEVAPLAAADAVELFCSRGAVSPEESVIKLCARLDNMPLAVELAAARAAVLTPAQILARLGHGLDLLKGGRDADPRQASLRATIKWSHDLLEPDDQEVFARLAAFQGGCTLEAAEDVCGANIDNLQSLVDKSLLRHTGDRFRMLETIHEFAAERLAAQPDAAATLARHGAWLCEFGRRLDARRRDQDETLDRLRAEMPNVRAAVNHLKQNGPEVDRLELVTALAQPMFQMGAARESSDWLEEAITDCHACPAETQARAHVAASLQATLSGDADRGARHASRAASLTLGGAPRELKSDVLLARGVAEQALANYATAQEYTAEALAIAEELGDLSRIGELRNNLAYLALCAGNLDLARTTATAALPDALQRRDHHIAATLLHNLSLVALKSGVYADAHEPLAEALRLSRAHELRSVLGSCVEAVAAVAANEGDYQFAATLLGAVSSRTAGSVEDVLREAVAASARDVLGESEFARLMAVGAALDIAEAAGRAQGWLDSNC